jgi:alpha-tubulin N-acetyltransferase 1
MGVASTKA